MAGDEEAGKPKNAPPTRPDPAAVETPPQGMRAPRPAASEEAESDGPALLPETKTEYAAPRSLPAAQRDAAVAPVATIEVDASASASAVVRERDERAEAPHEDRAVSSTMDTLPPRGRAATSHGRIAALGAIVAVSATVTCVALLRLTGRSERAGAGAAAVTAPRAAAAAQPPSAATAAAGQPPVPEPAASPAGADAEPAEGVAAAVAPPPKPVAAPLPLADLPREEKTPPPKPRTTSHAAPTPPRAAAGGSIVRESPF